MHGLHLTADLHDCRPQADALMTEPEVLRRHCLAAVRGAGLQPVGELFHRFAAPAPGSGPQGVTGVVLLAESHLAVHTWPELGAVTLDVYVCNFGADNSRRAEQLIGALLTDFCARRCIRQSLQRGTLQGVAAPVVPRD